VVRVIVNSLMPCNRCSQRVQIKATSEYISLRCGCNCIIHYPSGKMSEIPLEKFKKNYRGQEND